MSFFKIFNTLNQRINEKKIFRCLNMNLSFKLAVIVPTKLIKNRKRVVAILWYQKDLYIKERSRISKNVGAIHVFVRCMVVSSKFTAFVCDYLRD